jgi:integrase/recombinase XerD
MALSPKTITNMHTNLSALYTWAYNTELVDKHLLRMIPRPEYERPEIEAFTQEEVKRLLAACGYARTWKTRDTRSRRPTAERDRLIICVLLSTGVRASELCEIRLQDVDMSRNAIHVQGKGRGRGSKPRTVYFGKRTAKALWAYLTPRLEGMRPADRLFTVGTDDDPRPLRRRVLWRHLKRIGERAGVDDVSPHRFRHTFAIEFLRNSEDPRALYVLQDLLGHSSLQTVRIYATIAERDHADVAEIADPVDNWRL